MRADSWDIMIVEWAFSILAMASSFPLFSRISRLYTRLTASESALRDRPSTCTDQVGPAQVYHC